MNDEFLKVTDELPSYDGLARAATIVGMPLVPTMITLVGSLFAVMLLLPILQAKAFTILLITIPILLFIKTLSANDDQALRIIAIQVLWALRRRNYFLFGKTNTILATRFGRQYNDYKRFFE